MRCVFKDIKTDSQGNNFGEAFDGKIRPETKELFTEYIVKKDDSEFAEAIFIKEIKNCQNLVEEEKEKK